MTHPAGHVPPWRWLVGLTLLVLAAHMLLLQARPGAFSIGVPSTTRALLTRSVVRAPEVAKNTAPAPTPPRVARAAPEPTHALATAPLEAAPNSGQNPTPAPVESMQDATNTVAPNPSDPQAHKEAAADTPPAATLASAALAASNALAVPSAVTLHYTVTGSSRQRSYQAQSRLRWRHDGVAYEAALEISAFLLGERAQTSAGRITAEGLAPTRFTDKARSLQATHFEWAKGKLIFSNNAPEAVLLAGAQDRLSVFMQLGAMVGGEPTRYPPGTTIALPTAGARELEVWTFTVVGAETLQLPGGEQATIKLERPSRREFDPKVEVWIAPNLDHLPARIRLSQSTGDFVDQQWLKTFAD